MARLEEWLPRAARLRACGSHRIRLIGPLCRPMTKGRRPMRRRPFFRFAVRAHGRLTDEARYAATISNECDSSAVLAIMIDAEQYLSCDRLIARSTVAGFRLRPVTVKWKWIFVNTFGSSLARSACSVTEQPMTSWRLFLRISTTS
ncbi:hypothetical protein DM45_2473 [Burkholderia mallei]|nr:hypothetical protein DM75_2415 [Burkholderia mallei]KOS92179.1 hypothetical protein DM45_2473 [Burkholderia mallei]